MTDIIKDSTYSYRKDFRTEDKMKANLASGFEAETYVINKFKTTLKHISAIKWAENSSSEVNSNPDLSFSRKNAHVKVEIQFASKSFTGYGNKNYPALAELGPVFHIKEHKVKKLQEFSNLSDNHHAYLAHVRMEDGVYAIYLIDKFDKMVHHSCVPFGGKMGYVVSEELNLTPNNSFDEQIKHIKLKLKGEQN